MKKDRNCGMQPQMAPGMMPGAVPYGGGMPYGMAPGMAPGMMAPGMAPGMMPGMMPATPGFNPSAGMAPGMPTMPGASCPNSMPNQGIDNMEQMQAQINNLDRRVSRLESMIQDTKSSSFSSNKFTESNSNYHMM